jgi:hypothetical protein
MLYVTAALVGLVVGPSVPAWADVTYVYTGNTYRNSGSPNFAGGFSPPYTAADYVTATLTLKNEIGANQTAFFVPFSDIVVFTMSDGVQTLDVFSPQLYAEGANFATDSFGNITQWSVLLETSIPGPPGLKPLTASVLTSKGFGNTPPWTADDSGWFSYVGTIPGYGEYVFQPTGEVLNDPGTWTVVPEPSSVALVAIGLLGMMAPCGEFRARSRGSQRGTWPQY